MIIPCFAQAPKQAPDSAVSIWEWEIRAELTLGDSTCHSAEGRTDKMNLQNPYGRGKMDLETEILAKPGAAHNSCSQGSALCSRTEPGASQAGRDSSRSQRESSGLGCSLSAPSRDRDLQQGQGSASSSPQRQPGQGGVISTVIIGKRFVLIRKVLGFI